MGYAATTKQPTGLTLDRSGQMINAAWKIQGPDYDAGENARWTWNGNSVDMSGGYTTIQVDPGQTSVSWEIYFDSYYPRSSTGRKLTQITFFVRGRRAEYTQDGKTYTPSLSSWSSISKTIHKPKDPSLSVTTPQWPVARFDWSVATDDTDWYPATDVVYESVLLKDSSATVGSGIDWTETRYGQRYTGTGLLNDALSITDDSSTLSDGHSYTRWFRVKARGIAGDSDWVYGKHIYAIPKATIINDIDLSKKDSATGYDVLIKSRYNATELEFNGLYPVDHIDYQYTISTPNADVTAPVNPNWQTALTAAVYDLTSGAVFTIDDEPGIDQALFIRANSVHDIHTTYGSPIIAQINKLTPPTGLTIDADAETYQVRVTATNASQVADSFLVVRYFDYNHINGVDIGIIPAGEHTIDVQCPWWTSSPTIGVYAAAGSYEMTGSDGEQVEYYTVTAKAKSDVVKTGGTIPAAPTVYARMRSTGDIEVNWYWSWAAAKSAEVSWSTDREAWESTNQPKTFTIIGIRASRWIIADPSKEDVTYIRVRLIEGAGDNAIYGPYSEIATVYPSTIATVSISNINLSSPSVTENEDLTISWDYYATDESLQDRVMLYELIESGGESWYSLVKQEYTAQPSITIRADDVGWQGGTTHTLQLVVVSASRVWSDYTAVGSVSIATPPECQIVTSDIVPVTIESVDESGDPVTYTMDGIKSLPLAVSVTGAGVNTTTSVVIERANDYQMNRPDERVDYGYAGETIAVQTQSGAANNFVFNVDNLIGRLDNGATYKIIATVTNASGQKAIAERSFVVKWDVHPEIPEADVVIDKTSRVAMITPLQMGQTLINYADFEPGGLVYGKPMGEDENARDDRCRTIGTFFDIGTVIAKADTEIELLVKRYDDAGEAITVITTTTTPDGREIAIAEGTAAVRISVKANSVDELQTAGISIDMRPVDFDDTRTCDIYRLSADKPELVYACARFGQTYVDPYPTIGEYGGYRIVCKSATGDYVTADNRLAWDDAQALLKLPYNIINFGRGEARLIYNADIQNVWKKSFKETSYLGGATQGDWTGATNRTGTIGGVHPAEVGKETVEAMRRLADYNGICHVRSKDGSSYDANVDVSEKYNYAEGVKTYDYTLAITKIDPEELAGMTIEEWNKVNDQLE